MYHSDAVVRIMVAFSVSSATQNTEEKRVMIHSSQCSPKAVQISLHCSASVSRNNICDRKLKIMGEVQAEEKWCKPGFLCCLSARAP